jgi:hypothetical protein
MLIVTKEFSCSQDLGTGSVALDPTPAQCRKVIRCLRRLVNTVGPFLGTIIKAADSLFADTVLYGATSAGLGAVAVATYFFAPFSAINTYITTGVAGVSSAGFAVAAGFKFCEYSKAVTCKFNFLCTIIVLDNVN